MCPTAWLLAGGSQVHNRLNLALPFAVPRPLAALALVAASLTQIASAGVFISGYGGRAYERAVSPAPSLRVPERPPPALSPGSQLPATAHANAGGRRCCRRRRRC